MVTKWVNVESIGSYFESLSDPRHSRNRKHLLVDVVVIAVWGMLCGSDGPTDIHREWIAHVIRNDGSGLDRLIAIDGKTCRRFHDAS
jgi:hypothetical protein